MEDFNMISEATIQKLIKMRLSVMADTYRQQLASQDYQQLTFEERFGLLVDSEYLNRRNNHLKRLIKNAEFSISTATIEGIEYYADRELPKGLIIELSAGTYLANKRNVIILGPTGAGKTYLSCALGVAACRNDYSVKYIRLPELLNEIVLSRSTGQYHRVIKKYQKVTLLIIDEWLLVPLNEIESRDLLEIIEKRSSTGSTIFCSQFGPAGWHQKIGQGTLADAILDRIIHNAYTITISGTETMRKRKSQIR
jgi:DNA replication protein DnaC